jgi:hypothetical protein
MTATAGDRGQSPDPIEESARQFEEETRKETRRIERIVSRLKPFALGRASPTDYNEIASSGLPRPSEVFFLFSAPELVPMGTIMPDGSMVAPGPPMATTICDEPFGPHMSIAELVVDGSLGAGGLEKKPRLAPSFEPLARLYGYAGRLIRLGQRDAQVLAEDIVHVWNQGKSMPPASSHEAAVQVTTYGPDALDELSLDQPTRETMRRLLDKGTPVSLRGFHREVVHVFNSGLRRTTPSEKIDEAEDLLTEMGVFWLLRFRWRWCTYRREPHWYIAGHQEQYACVRHQDTVQQDRFRHRQT